MSAINNSTDSDNNTHSESSNDSSADLGIATEPSTSALLMHDAFERTKPFAEVLDLRDTREIQLAVGDMIETMLVSEPQMQNYCEDLSKLGTFDMTNLDRLRDYTYALAHMYTRFRAASAKPSPASVAQLVTARQLLHRHASALALSGFFDETHVDGLIRGKSRRQLAYDVIALTNLFLDAGSLLDGKTPLTRAQLVEIQAEATAMLTVIGERDARKTERAQLTPLYRQLYTLAYNAYNEVRDALTYVLRNRPDAVALLKRIAPSLHESRGRRRPASKPPTAASAPAVANHHDTSAVVEVEPTSVEGTST